MLQFDVSFNRKAIKSISGLESFFTHLGVPKKAAVFINERTLDKIINQIMSLDGDEDKIRAKFLKEAKRYKIVVLNNVKRNTLTVIS